MICSKCGDERYLLVIVDERILCLVCFLYEEPVMARLFVKQLSNILSYMVAK
jgi:hypothetical protein